MYYIIHIEEQATKIQCIQFINANPAESPFFNIKVSEGIEQVCEKFPKNCVVIFWLKLLQACKLISKWLLNYSWLQKLSAWAHTQSLNKCSKMNSRENTEVFSVDRLANS